MHITLHTLELHIALTEDRPTDIVTYIEMLSQVF